ncbi:3-dehydroquinate synthase [Pullulanibacillus camelliae]|uniref:3-dehydroquinate synthase n=1 Tax=Pullulanibacillus camelliae TaxID=1707096 RepID=A0A8J2VUK2_9BACL|nr:3-dehydroquinate synthase [Pullulanibacillus camelliae]GGE38789.1 3-dehydroquinate synthase [Pullulanibacillus camelliae]
MERLDIQTPHKNYPVIIGDGLRFKLTEFLSKSYSAYVIITDDHVAPLYLEDVKTALSFSTNVFDFVVPAGETAKSFATYKRLIDDIVALNLDRKSCVIALGGGVIGDLAGFVAATFLRGVAFIQMPTTLLSHDSSIGGKVGINHEHGKNLIGAFYHPEAVLYDTECLKTLPASEWRSGLAEVVKHAIIDSPELYHRMRQEIPTFDAIDLHTFAPLLKAAMAVKANVVANDELEAGMRKFLNFGHTLGHAIEKESGYGVLSHGEAVAIGMIFALRLSERIYHIALPVAEIIAWFKRLSLPIAIPKGLTSQQLLERMKYDKKRADGHIVFVLLKAIGEPEVTPVEDAVISNLLAEFING